MNPELLSALRSLLAMLAGLAVGKGWLTADQATQLGGILLAVATLAWSVWNARHQKHAKVDAAAEGIILGAQMASPQSDASLSDAEPKVQDAVRAKVADRGGIISEPAS